MRRDPTVRPAWLDIRTLLCVVVIGLSATGGAFGADDRSPYAATINPVTGEVTAGPSNYPDTQAPNRSALAPAINASTGEVTAGPATYVNTQTPDRSAFSATINASTGQVTAGPGTYVNTQTPDRSSFAATIASDGQVTAGPATYPDTQTPNRWALAPNINPITGEVLTGPSYSMVLTTLSRVPLLPSWGPLALAGALLLIGWRYVSRRRGVTAG